ncbi:MAG: hypothetical protein ACYTF1_15975 [Planctomycetota bacterium]|jgi:hypothetical protein
MANRSIVMFTFVLLAATAICSCSKDRSPAENDTATTDPAFEVRKSYGTGPVKLTVELSNKSITTAQALICRITLDSAEDFVAEFPDIAFPEDMPGAILTDYNEKIITKGGHRLDIREYELEPEFEGSLQLPAMEVYYHRAGEVKEEILETKPVQIVVEATPETGEQLALKPLRGLITVEQIQAQRRRVWPWILASVLAVVAGIVLMVYLIRRPRPVPPPPPAHETALKRLKKLLASDWIDTGQVEPFFVEVTAIVRDYIEEKFGLHAPEQTTEEFLSHMVTEPLVAQHSNVLGPFLTAADEVKFACSTPEKPAMQRAYDTAENFVVQTANTGEGGK